MGEAERIARGLRKASRQADGSWRACCPVHDDRNPSLTLSVGSDGKVLVCCHAGCDQQNVIEELKALDLWPTSDERRPARTPGHEMPVSPVPAGTPEPDFEKLLKRKPLAIYEYRTGDGRIAGYVARLETEDGKTIRPVTRWRDAKGNESWRLKGFAAPRPLFGLELLQANPNATVIIVEGEKATLAGRVLYPDHCVVT
jgi:hypothetical protein